MTSRKLYSSSKHSRPEATFMLSRRYEGRLNDENLLKLLGNI
jgi:hypothetical protein